MLKIDTFVFFKTFSTFKLLTKYNVRRFKYKKRLLLRCIHLFKVEREFASR